MENGRTEIDRSRQRQVGQRVECAVTHSSTKPRTSPETGSALHTIEHGAEFRMDEAGFLDRGQGRSPNREKACLPNHAPWRSPLGRTIGSSSAPGSLHLRLPSAGIARFATPTAQIAHFATPSAGIACFATPWAGIIGG
jgi:hypothetical protein